MPLCYYKNWKSACKTKNWDVSFYSPFNGKYIAENSCLLGLLEDMKINELRKSKWKQTHTWSCHFLSFKPWPQNSNIFSSNALIFSQTFSVLSQEPLNLPGWQTRSKNFKTPFFSRYQKILPWGNSNGSKTSPNFFLKKYLNKYGR